MGMAVDNEQIIWYLEQELGPWIAWARAAGQPKIVEKRLFKEWLFRRIEGYVYSGVAKW